MGDHLREAGMDCWLIGKTHMKADAKGLERLGLAPDTVIGARQGECGFDVWLRDDGLWAAGPDGAYDTAPSPYNAYLKSLGYPGENPWADFANAGDDDGQIASGWFYQNADRPANIAEEHSETPWLTGEAIKFIEPCLSGCHPHPLYVGYGVEWLGRRTKRGWMFRSAKTFRFRGRFPSFNDFSRMTRPVPPTWRRRGGVTGSSAPIARRRQSRSASPAGPASCAVESAAATPG